MSRKAIETCSFRGFKSVRRTPEEQKQKMDELCWRYDNGLDLYSGLPLKPSEREQWEALRTPAFKL